MEEKGLRIAKMLGSKKAAILANHGTPGKSVESCVFWFMGLDTCCRVQFSCFPMLLLSDWKER